HISALPRESAGSGRAARYAPGTTSATGFFFVRAFRKTRFARAAAPAPDFLHRRRSSPAIRSQAARAAPQSLAESVTGAVPHRPCNNVAVPNREIERHELRAESDSGHLEITIPPALIEHVDEFFCSAGEIQRELAGSVDPVERLAQIVIGLPGVDPVEQKNAFQILLDRLLACPEKLRQQRRAARHPRRNVIAVSHVAERAQREIVHEGI